MIQYTRKELLKKLYSKINLHEPIIIGGAGYGLMAKAEDRAGIDMIMAYNTGPYRMNGHISTMGYRPYSDSNYDTLWLGQSMLNAVETTPVIGGIGPTDPYRDINMLIDELLRLGFSGFTNVPSNDGNVGDPMYANVLRHYRMGLEADISLIRKCRAKDVFTITYTFSEESMKAHIDAGVDAVSVHVGGTSGGMTGPKNAKPRSIEECCEMTQRYYDIAVKERPDIIIVTHGGPFDNPKSVKMCFDNTRIHGVIGASSIERIPVEQAVYRTVRDFLNLKLR